MGPDLSIIPTIDAALNTTSAVLIGSGYIFIRRRNIPAHKACMIAATVEAGAKAAADVDFSDVRGQEHVKRAVLFLACYLTYHYFHGTTHFAGEGLVRSIYLSILASHTVLAAVIVPLVIVTLYRALSGRFDKHRRIARWTLPIWLYVSVTGVVVYWMLYHLVW